MRIIRLSDAIHVQRQKWQNKPKMKKSQAQMTNQIQNKSEGLHSTYFSPESSKITDYHSSWMKKKMKEKIGNHAFVN